MNAKEILIAVRREVWISTGKTVSALILMGLVIFWFSDDRFHPVLGVVLAVVFVFQVIFGQYIPVRNRHESLLSQYGEVYVAEAQYAMEQFGMRKLLRTSWFATYAAEFCRRNEQSGKS